MDLFEILTGPLRRLHNVQRYSSAPLNLPENVAEHSWDVAVLSLLIALDWNKLTAQEQADIGKLDIAKVTTRALLHDVSEAMSGDIIRSFKYSTPDVSEAMLEADTINMHKLTETMGTAEEFVMDAWNRSKSGYEGDVVALADLLVVVIKCAEEWSMGNRHMDLICQRAYENIRDNTPAWLARYVNQIFPLGEHSDVYRQIGEI